MCCLVEKQPSKRLISRPSNKLAQRAHAYYEIAHPSSDRKPVRKDREYFVRKKRGSLLISRSGTGSVHDIKNLQKPLAEPTRRILRDRNLSVIDFMRANRAETLQMLSAIMCTAMVLSLASSLLFGVHIVNPVPALLVFVTFAGFFLVGVTARRSHDVDH